MWEIEIDPVDLCAAVAVVVIYSLPFGALWLEFKLKELKERAEEREIRRAILRRQLTGI